MKRNATQQNVLFEWPGFDAASAIAGWETYIASVWGRDACVIASSDVRSISGHAEL